MLLIKLYNPYFRNKSPLQQGALFCVLASQRPNIVTRLHHDAPCATNRATGSRRRTRTGFTLIEPLGSTRSRILRLLHSIISSARASKVGGSVIPSSLAVFRLMTNLMCAGRSIGRSAGLMPFRIRSIKSAARSVASLRSAP